MTSIRKRKAIEKKNIASLLLFNSDIVKVDFNAATVTINTIVGNKNKPRITVSRRYINRIIEVQKGGEL